MYAVYCYCIAYTYIDIVELTSNRTQQIYDVQVGTLLLQVISIEILHMASRHI